MSFRLLGASLLVLTAVSVLPAEEWPGWRGPRGDGTSTETGIPTKWSKTENVAWVADVPGVGHSSPVVWGDRVFLTTCLEKEEKRDLLCYDRRDGKLLWQRTVVTAKLEKKHSLNSYASSTPATDGERVWVSFFDNPSMVVVCYDNAGNEVWRKVPGEFHSVHGFCSPPILYKDLVILNGDQDAVAYLVALEKATGKEVWRTDRPNKTRSYCPPLIVTAAGKTEMVLSGSKCVAGYSPDDGKELWLVKGPTEQFVASLVYADDLFFMTAGFPEYHTMAIKPDGDVAWHFKGSSKEMSYVPSPIADGHYFFLVSDLGFVSCYEAKTGERPWKEEKLGKHHSASPVSAEGRLYFPDDAGVTYVLKAGPKFEVLAKNELEEDVRASPAIAHGQIFIRTTNHLYCIGKNGN
jgi:outer membrane protein assembly factor BamB